MKILDIPIIEFEVRRLIGSVRVDFQEMRKLMTEQGAFFSTGKGYKRAHNREAVMVVKCLVWWTTPVKEHIV